MNRQSWLYVFLIVVLGADAAQAQTSSDDAVYQEGLTLLQQFDESTSSLRGSFVQTVRRPDRPHRQTTSAPGPHQHPRRRS
ncbi:MAG: hypothetical protein AAGJ86_04035, partial [Pseudomonadota bacterium]